MNEATESPAAAEGAGEEPPPPASVMCFNAADACGAGGLSADIATISAMGGHALPITCTVLLRDTAEVFDQHALDDEVVVEQSRTVLEDITISGWKVGFLGNAENISAVAEILSDYPDLPLVSSMPSLSWLDEDQLQPYLDAFRELILPATEVLVGNHKTLTDFLLPEWDSERPPSARELAAAAGQHGTRYVLVTGIALPSKGAEQYIDNVLASPQGALAGEKFERFETGFAGAGDTLAAALAALLASGAELQAAVSEALSFLDQSLDAGFRPGMGNVVPDRFFWAMPPGEEGQGEEGTAAEPDFATSQADAPAGKGAPRRVH